MKRVLLIQSRLKPERLARELNEYRAALGETASVTGAQLLGDGFDPETLLQGYDALLIGGSGDLYIDGGRAEDEPERAQAKEALRRIAPVIDSARKNQVPVLGVCFGHQLVAELAGGKVTHDHSQKKTGTYEVALTDNGKKDPLFKNLPERFLAQYAHKDSVTALPAEAVLLAFGDACRFSALRYGDERIYSVQFHPELTKQNMIELAKLQPQYLPEGADPAGMFRESDAASSLLQAFIELT